MNRPSGFECHDLGDGHNFFTGFLLAVLTLDASRFDELLEMDPADYHEVRIHGRTVHTPRWQQAYGMDYHYTGRVNRALPIPPALHLLLVWAREAIDGRLNGVLVNWYDGSRGHYIGRHRDSRANMVAGAPIVTISFGQERSFRLRPWPNVRGRQRIDFKASDGTVFVMPFETNLSWTHEVPSSSKWKDRRISVTLRAFETSS